VEYIRSKWAAILIISILFVGAFGYFDDTVSAEANFSDVPMDKHYSGAVYQLSDRGIIGGYADGTFKPGNSITRGQAAAIMAKLLNLDTKNVKNPGFKDVPEGLWSYSAIAAAAEQGIFRGYADGRFGPNDKITRGQMASILIKAFGFHYLPAKDEPFTDLYKLESHRESVYTLYKLGIASGTSKTTFSPNDAITRAQAAVLITKAEEVRSSTLTLKSTDYGWPVFDGFKDYQQDYIAPEQQEEEIILVLPNSKNRKYLQIVPLKEGTKKLVVNGQKVLYSGPSEHQKYYVTVSKENGQLKTHLEETKDVYPTIVDLKVKKEPIVSVSLSKMDGQLIDENVKYEPVKEYQENNSLSLLLSEPGQYIATVEFADGTKVRYGLEAVLVPSDFYYTTYSIKEIPKVTVDLSQYTGNNFSEYRFDEEIDGKTIRITKKNANTFQIEGLSKGNASIRFPQNYKPNGITRIDVQVRKIGSILEVTANVSDYEDLFY
jgi:hypothetical protein